MTLITVIPRDEFRARADAVGIAPDEATSLYRADANAASRRVVELEIEQRAQLEAEGRWRWRPTEAQAATEAERIGVDPAVASEVMWREREIAQLRSKAAAPPKADQPWRSIAGDGRAPAPWDAAAFERDKRRFAAMVDELGIFELRVRNRLPAGTENTPTELTQEAWAEAAERGADVVVETWRQWHEGQASAHAATIARQVSASQAAIERERIAEREAAERAANPPQPDAFAQRDLRREQRELRELRPLVERLAEENRLLRVMQFGSREEKKAAKGRLEELHAEAEAAEQARQARKAAMGSFKFQPAAATVAAAERRVERQAAGAGQVVPGGAGPDSGDDGEVDEAARQAALLLGG